MFSKLSRQEGKDSIIVNSHKSTKDMEKKKESP